MINITLTEKGQDAMLKIKSRYNDIKHTYGQNTLQRVVFENGKVPSAMIFYAIGNPTQDDIDEMVRNGYAQNDH